ncbi:MAG: hypothetical protein QOI88_3518 [Gammaproteobacteria bacterium]|jgi:uncharacterized membrane protein YkvI|nr:hypothetical protein [Gammaproteobacteria bacterium]
MHSASNDDGEGPSWLQRFVLPGLAFKAVVIGGGYSTGRELAEYFMPSGPWGGLAGMVLAMCVWSVVAVVTFLFARATRAQDYRTFFRNLLGPFATVFDLAYLPYIVLLLSVFGAAAGALGAAVFGWQALAGTLCLMVATAVCVAFGNTSVERLFKWVSVLLYATYALFLLIAIAKFGNQVAPHFALPADSTGWAVRGLTYAAYNIIGAVVILPVTRHLTSGRDALIAGALAGPLAMLPALIFFVCMCAFYPQIQGEVLPSDFILREMDLPAFHLLFQLMIFSALLESGTGCLHAINERIAATLGNSAGRTLSSGVRFAIASVILIGAVFCANRFGLVTLIAKGYRGLAYTMLALYVVPLLTVGLWKLRRPGL